MPTELSERIDALYSLQKGEYDPAVHDAHVREIVKAYGVPSPHFFKFSDLFELTSSNRQLDEETGTIKSHVTRGIIPEVVQAGEYTIRRFGKVGGRPFVHITPSLDITHWRTNVLGQDGESVDRLLIYYRKMSPVQIVKYGEQEHSLQIGSLNLSYISVEAEWKHRITS